MTKMVGVGHGAFDQSKKVVLSFGERVLDAVGRERLHGIAERASRTQQGTRHGEIGISASSCRS